MDFERLVEGGSYDPEEIRDPFARGEVHGLRRAIEDVACFIENWKADNDDGTVTSRLREEFAESLAGDIAEWLRCTRYETIVSILDNEASGQEGQP